MFQDTDNSESTAAENTAGSDAAQGGDETTLIEDLKDNAIEVINDPSALWDVTQGLIIALLIFLIGKRIARMLSSWTTRGLERANTEVMLVRFLSKLVYYVLLVVVIITALSQLGIKTTSLLAILGAAGLAVGLALKDSLSNFASGVMLVIFRPFRLGDFVEVAGVSGSVIETGIFNTTLKTPDNKKVILPNNLVTSDPIVNYSALDTRRIDLTIGVDYEDDLKVARDVMLKVMREHSGVLSDPEPQVLMMELADSSVNFSARSWVKTADFWPVRSDLLERMKVELELHGCSIPYPQTSLSRRKKSAA